MTGLRSLNPSLRGSSHGFGAISVLNVVANPCAFCLVVGSPLHLLCCDPEHGHTGDDDVVAFQHTAAF